MKSEEILRIYPDISFSRQLLNFIDAHQDFEQSLKVSNPRFVIIRPIILSYPVGRNDEVIGTFYYDTHKKIFKQDYIVNIDFLNQEYVSYSRMSGDFKETQYAKGIDTFFEEYGKWKELEQQGEFYCRSQGKRGWMHHYENIEELPEPIQDYARKTSQLSSIN